MKKLLFTLAAAATFAAMAGDPNKRDPGDIDLIGFDNFSVLTNVVDRDDYGNESANTTQWVSTTGDDESIVKTYGGDNIAKGSGLTYPAPFLDEGNNYLALDTNGGELQRYLSPKVDNSYASTNVAPTGTYIDTLVQFTVTEDEAPTIGANDKLAIWLQANEGETNLMVQAGWYSDQGSLVEGGAAFALKKAKGDRLEVVPAKWYRLTIKALPNQAEGEEFFIPAFEIKLDGESLAATNGYSLSAGALTNFGETFSNETKAKFVAGTLFTPCCVVEEAKLSCVGFQGTGAIDDFVVTTNDPFPPSVIDFTLTWTASEVSAVSYVLSTDLATTNTLTNGTAVQLAPGDGTATIELIPTFTTGYEFDKVTMGETELGLTFAIPGVTTNATLFAKADTPAYPTYIDITDTTIKGKYDAWKNTYQADTQSAWETAFLLNMDPTESVAAGTALLKIASITEVSGGWELEIVSDATTLTAETNNDGLVGNGYLAITYAADLATLTSGGTTVNLPVTVTDGKIKVTVSAPGAKFMKATLTSTPASQE